MPTPTYKPLITYTLPGSVGTIKFYNLSAAYRDLVVVVAGSSATNTDLSMTFNDNTTGYSYSRVNVNGTAAPTSTNANAATAILGPAYGGSPTSAVFHVMDYSATDKHKTVVYEGAQLSQNYFGVGRWANSAAIHTVQFTGTYTAGMTFSIYGIAA